MLQYINILRYVRRYQWLAGIALLLVAMFVLSSPPVPKDLNYRYQLDAKFQRYPLVAPTAGLVQWSTERVREVYRWNLTAETTARAVPKDKAGTPDAVLPATMFIILGIMAMCLIWFVPRYRMAGIGLVALVLAGSHLGAHPAAYVRLMAAPSTLVPNIAVALVTKAEPGRTLGIEGKAQNRLKDMADRYYEHYITFTEHRMGMAGKLFAGPKRLWFGVSGLVYVLPFALLLALLAALTTLTQTVLWALCVLAPFGLAVALIDGRAGLKIWQHVMEPLLAATVLLAIEGLVLPVVLFLATLVHAMENELGLLVIGSIFPALVVVGAALLYRRLRGGSRERGAKAGLFGHVGDHHRTQLLGAPRRGLRLLLPRARRARE